MLRFLLSLILILPSFSLVAQSQSPIQQALKKLLEHPEMKHASLGLFARELETDSTIVDHGSDLSLVPASTMKLVTSAAALEILGDSMRYKTEVEYDGALDGNRVLQGNIYVRGGGDPTIGSKHFGQDYRYPIPAVQAWADSIAALGIDSIHGSVVGDASIYNFDMVPSTWIWGDMGNYYGAAPSGLSVYDNTYKLIFSSKPQSGARTRIVATHPEIPGLEVENYVLGTDIDHDDAYIFGAPYTFQRYARGEIPKGRKAFEVRASVPDPALLMAQLLNRELEKRGVHMALPATTLRMLKQQDNYVGRQRALILTHYSPPLRDIVRWVNTKSVNLFAEHLLVAIGARQLRNPSIQGGTKAVEAFWQRKGIGKRGLYMNDGSGLSRFNSITPRQMAGILEHMTDSDHFDAFYASLSESGGVGTLSSVGRGTPAQGNLRGKSGTMTRVKSYAGYVKSRSGKMIVFSMILNNCDCSSYRAKAKLEQLMIALSKMP